MVAVPSLPDDKSTPSAPVAKGGVEAPRRSPFLYTMGIVMLGVGVVGLTAGTIFGIAAMGADDGDSSIKGYALGSTLSFLAGAGFSGGGGYLLLTNMPDGRNPNAARVILAPRPNGLSLSGTF